MFLMPLRKSLRAGLVAGVALVLCTGFNHSYAMAQDSHAAVAQDSAAAKSPERARIEGVLKGLDRGRSVGQVAVAPDGKRLAWIEHAKEGAEIRVAPLEDLKKSERVTAASKPEQHCHEGEMAWSPDAQALAFFSDCGRLGEQTDLYLSRLDGKPVRRLTELKGDVEAPAFSPDGSRVGFLYVEGATRPSGALAAQKPPSGVIGEEGVEIQRVAVVQVAAGGGKQEPPWLPAPRSGIAGCAVRFRWCVWIQEVKGNQRHRVQRHSYCRSQGIYGCPALVQSVPMERG